MSTPPAIAVFEFDSIAIGTRAADAMVKKAPIDLFRIGTVQPGKYVVMIGGSVASVEEARIDGLRFGGDAIKDEIFLPDVHPQVYGAVTGSRNANDGDALGIIETCTIPVNIAAADKAIKAAAVTIVEIRLGDGLGGKGVTHLTGKLEDVEAAVEAGLAVVDRPSASSRHAIIPVQHAELRASVEAATQFYP